MIHFWKKEEDRKDVTKHAVKEYIQEKMSLKEQSQQRLPATRTTAVTQVDIKAAADPGSFAEPKVAKVAAATSQQLKSPPKNKTISLNDVAQSQHANVAAVMDYLGPAVTVKRTFYQTSTNSNIPNGWYIRQSTFDVCSPRKDLDSAPTVISIKNASQHFAHRPIEWMVIQEHQEPESKRLG
jgi:hypothetical protein